MAPSKKAKIQKQEPKTFTIEELSEYWGWSVPEVRSHIRRGDLKKTLDTAVNLSNSQMFYKCDDDTRLIEMIFDPSVEGYLSRGENLLEEIENDTPLVDFIDPMRDENIISCSEYEYIDIPGKRAIEQHRNRNNISVRYFYDLEGNILIPICDGIPGYEDEYCVSFVSIEKHAYDSPLVSSKEVERFEKENTPERKGKNAESVNVERGDKILEILKEMGHDPMSLPKSRQGTSGVFGKAKKEYKKRYPDAGQDDFKNAFYWLIDKETIAYKE